MIDPALVDWLLAADTPSIRYLTQQALLHQPADRSAIMTSGPVPAMLRRQTPAGHWADEHSYYTPKYVSTHWTLALLEELRVDPADAGFQRGVAHMLDTTAASLTQRIDNGQTGFSCFWGNLLRYAAYAGQAGHPAVARMVGYAVDDIARGRCRCEHNNGYACAWGVARSLWGLAALPHAMQTRDVATAVDQGIDFLLADTRLVNADYPVPDGGRVHPLWFKLNFPLFYQADILFVLRVLAELDALDQPGAQGALDWLEARRGRNGRWRGSSPFRRRTWPELGGREETDRWVSLQTAVILQRAGRLEASPTGL